MKQLTSEIKGYDRGRDTKSLFPVRSTGERQDDPPDWRSLRVTTPDDMLHAIQREQDAWGMNHGTVGAQLCRKWGFPPLFEQGILRHHSPKIGDDLSVPGAFVFLAHMAAVGDMPEELILRALSTDSLAHLHLTASQVTAVSREMSPAAAAPARKGPARGKIAG
jgi:hypothetical protein